MKNLKEKVSQILASKKAIFLKMMALYVMWIAQIDVSLGQEKLIQKHYIKGGIYNTVHIINDFPALMPGFKLGWVYSNSNGNQIEVSPFITTLVNRVAVQKNNYGSTLYLDLLIAGIQFNYSKWQVSTLQFSAQLNLGMGFANQHFGNFDSDLESGYLMYSISPGFRITKILTDYLSISGGMLYNVTAGSKYFILPHQKLSGIQLKTEISLYIPI